MIPTFKKHTTFSHSHGKEHLKTPSTFEIKLNQKTNSFGEMKSSQGLYRPLLLQMHLRAICKQTESNTWELTPSQPWNVRSKQNKQLPTTCTSLVHYLWYVTTLSLKRTGRKWIRRNQDSTKSGEPNFWQQVKHTKLQERTFRLIPGSPRKSLNSLEKVTLWFMHPQYPHHHEEWTDWRIQTCGSLFTLCKTIFLNWKVSKHAIYQLTYIIYTYNINISGLSLF